MIFHGNFKRIVKEKTDMGLAAFMQELGINYSMVKALDAGGMQVLGEGQLAKICDKLQMSPKEFACLWDENYFEDEAPKGKPITSAEELKEKLRADGVLKDQGKAAAKTVKTAQATEPKKKKAKGEPKTTTENAVVDHPQHYTHSSIECIDIIRVMTADKAGIEAFCVGNVVKYLYRYQQKNGVEDVKKACWYLSKLVEVLES